MKLKKTIRTVSIITVASMAILLSGCSKGPSKKELQLSYDTLFENHRVATERVAELETILKGTQTSESPKAAISVIQDGTGRLTFNTNNGEIKFPLAIAYPASEQAPNTQSINLSNLVNLKPSNNWVYRTDGTAIELGHPSGISCKIQIGYIPTTADVKTLEPYIADLLKDFPPEAIAYTKIFLNETWWGLQAYTPTTIDEKEAVIRVGLLGFDKTSLVYTIIYNGAIDSTKEDIADALIKSIKIAGQELRLGN